MDRENRQLKLNGSILKDFYPKVQYILNSYQEKVIKKPTFER